MGSGTTLVAAHRAGRRGVGYDINSEYVNIASERLELGRRRPLLEEPAGRAVSPNGVANPLVLESNSGEDFQARAVRDILSVGTYESKVDRGDTPAVRLVDIREAQHYFSLVDPIER